MASVDQHARDDDRLRTDGPQAVDERLRFLGSHALGTIFRICEITCLRVIGIGEMSHRQHLAHAADG